MLLKKRIGLIPYSTCSAACFLRKSASCLCFSLFSSSFLSCLFLCSFIALSSSSRSLPSSSPGFPILRSSYLLNLQILDHLFNLLFLLLSHLLLKLLAFFLIGHPSVVVFARVIALLVSHVNCHPFLVPLLQVFLLLVASHRVKFSWIYFSLPVLSVIAWQE